MSLDQNAYLGQEKPGKLLRAFSVPCILSLLVSSLYNIVDQVFIGNSELGYLGNAATGVVFPILMIALAFSWCVGDGSAAYLSLCQGRGDTQSAHRCVGTGITVIFVTGLVLMAAGLIWREPLLRLFGASDATISMAMEYFTLLLYVLPLYMLSNSTNGSIRADGNPKYAMLATIAGAAVNIVLDPIFIFGLHWGIKGAAWATIIGQLVSFFLNVFYFRRPKTFRLERASFRPHWKVFWGAVQLGLSTFITQISIVVVSLVCNIMLFQYGTLSVYGPDIPISVISIETKVFTIVINLVVGVVLGGQPILGYNYGARQYDRVRKTYQLILWTTLAVGVASTLLFEFCPQVIIGIFGQGDPLYWEFATMTFRIFLSLVTFTCFIKMTSIFFQAVGAPVKATAASLIRDLVCFVPLSMVLPRHFGIKGVLFAAPAADLIAMVVATALTVGFFRQLKEQEAQPQAPEEALPGIRPSHPGPIITIARQHGTAGKGIGRQVAQALGIACYDKELAALAAQESGFHRAFLSELDTAEEARLHELYLSTTVVHHGIQAQAEIIRKIAQAGSCVIVGRAADYVLRDRENVVSIFLHAPAGYRVQKIMAMYGDNAAQATEHMKRSDAARGAYYKRISGNAWEDARNYTLCLDASQGVEATAQAILAYLQLHKS